MKILLEKNPLKKLKKCVYFIDIGPKGSSIKTSGYMKLSNGLILQWGYVLVTGIKDNVFLTKAVTYPIAFPNGPFSVNCTADSGWAPCLAQITGANLKNQFTIAFRRTGSTYDTGVAWFAVGN